MRPVKIFAAVLIALFAGFLLIALNDLRALASQSVADTALLLFCAVVSVGWIAFLTPLCWPLATSRPRPVHFAER